MTNKTEYQKHPVSIYVLLDRSGSMQSIHAETVAGFNAFLAGQQINGADARLTLVQFDSQDLADTLVDDQPIREVRSLRGRDFAPRAMTPLLDATGQIIQRAKAATPSVPDHTVVMVTITDGHENSSAEFSRKAIADLVAEQEAAGWIFVYLSAGLDSYEESGSIGYSAGSAQSWAPDGEGATLVFSSLNQAIGEVRDKGRRGEHIDGQQVFGTNKPAEADRRRKRGDSR